MPRGRATKSDALVMASVEILEQIQPCSVRAVCYQLFTAGVIGSMAKKETNRVSRNLTWAREHGQIPWEWIVDETRSPERIAVWDDPTEYADTVVRSYRKDYWATQPRRVEVWSEKGTVRGTLQPVLDKWGVTFRVMHGYGSATAVNDAAAESVDDDREFSVFYVGDWDPSGLHMSEVDLPGRIDRYGGEIALIRAALTDNDCALGLPSFSVETKRTDPRHGWFRRNYGATCWELDALDPRELRERVSEAIEDMVDMDAWEHSRMVERAEYESITRVMGDWKSILRQASE